MSPTTSPVRVEAKGSPVGWLRETGKLPEFRSTQMRQKRPLAVLGPAPISPPFFDLTTRGARWGKLKDTGLLFKPPLSALMRCAMEQYVVQRRVPGMRLLQT